MQSCCASFSQTKTFETRTILTNRKNHFPCPSGRMSGVLFYNRPFQKHHRTQRLKARHLFLQPEQPFRNDDIIFLNYAYKGYGRTANKSIIFNFLVKCLFAG